MNYEESGYHSRRLSGEDFECPHCGELDCDELVVIDSYLEDDYYVYEYECQTCGQSYKAYFRLDYVETDWRDDPAFVDQATRTNYLETLREAEEARQGAVEVVDEHHLIDARPLVEAALTFSARNKALERAQRACSRVAHQLDPVVNTAFDQGVETFIRDNYISIGPDGYWCFLGLDEQWEHTQFGGYNIDSSFPIQIRSGSVRFTITVPSEDVERQWGFVGAQEYTVQLVYDSNVAEGDREQMTNNRITGDFNAIAGALFSEDAPITVATRDYRDREEELERRVNETYIIRMPERSAAPLRPEDIEATRVPAALNLCKVGRNGYGNSVPGEGKRL